MFTESRCRARPYAFTCTQREPLLRPSSSAVGAGGPGSWRRIESLSHHGRAAVRSLVGIDRHLDGRTPVWQKATAVPNGSTRSGWKEVPMNALRIAVVALALSALAA